MCTMGAKDEATIEKIVIENQVMHIRALILHGGSLLNWPRPHMTFLWNSLSQGFYTVKKSTTVTVVKSPKLHEWDLQKLKL